MKPKTEIIQIHELSVQLTWKSNVRMIRLRVVPPNGTICASAPRWASRKAVISFFSDRYEWMQKAVQKVQSRPRPIPLNYIEGEQVLLFGVPYTLHVQTTVSKEKAHVSFDGQSITLYIKPDSTREKRAALLQAFYKERLSMAVSVYMNDYQSKLSCAPIPFRILRRKSVWGTYNVLNRSIIFNLALAKVPLECVQYVVLHEMTHQYVHAHNAEFYQRMSAFMPDWKQRRKALKSMVM